MIRVKDFLMGEAAGYDSNVPNDGNTASGHGGTLESHQMVFAA